MMSVVALVMGLVLGSSLAFAGTAMPDPGVAWLEKVANAARGLNYTGTFVYQYGDQVETSRIWHVLEGARELEKLEVLDGPAREVIRTDDEVQCFYPDTKTVRVNKRRAKSFPALLPQQLASLTEYYTVRLGDRERVAGRDAQILVLEPKDGLRYGHKLWADNETGLLLKARMINERKETVEQFAFTQVSIGGNVDKEALKPKYDGQGPGWRRDASGAAESASTDSGWVVGSYPAGFRKIMETKRKLPGRPAPVAHIVYSDGLAAISVFIEPMAGNARPVQGVSHQGAVNIYSRPLDDHMVTVLGEAPSATVVEMGQSVSAK
jgi:sigma-E factor negative regulatory protein RseB